MTLIICSHCGINTIEKYYSRKYCDECKPKIKLISQKKYLEKRKKPSQKNIEICVCEICKINTFEKISTKKYCDDCAIKQKKLNHLNFREKNKKVEILNCIRCKVNTFEKYKMKKYCDVCTVLVRRERCNNYKQKNKEKIKEYNKLYKNEHKEEIKEKRKIYDEKNRDSINYRQNIYLKIRRQTDFNFKIAGTMRSRLRRVLKGKTSKSVMKYLGCEISLFKKWIEFQFEHDMTLTNHGTLWHIDHVLPCANFNFENEEDKEMCFHWTNIKPMYASQNMSKKDSISLKEVFLHEIKIFAFIRRYSKLSLLQFSRYAQFLKCCS